MLMLERAAETVNPSECNDPAVLLACSLGSDSCPAACRADEETTVDENGNKVVVKSGDLSISATAAEGRKVSLNGGISDLDTITLKASEAITLNSVTLERFGFSSYKDVKNIWLENANGVKIANEKSISSSKDTVTLNIKKEYRTIEANDTITIVVETNPFDAGSCADNTGAPVAAATTEAQCLAIAATNVWTAASYDTKIAGSTIGFKVTSVESSAKNLDIANYDAYLYDMVTYDSSKVTVSIKGKDQTYHYNNGNAYEVARFQVKAGNAAVNVNGFTLTNDATLVTYAGKSLVDLDKFVDEVIVSLSDGTKLSNVKFDANKDDELKVSFDEVEVEINKNIIFVVEVVFKDFDDYGKAVGLRIKNSGDLNVVEKKTGARATVQTATPIAMHEYLFQGGKIEVTNEKLADNIDAAAGSTNITIGKGKIALGGEAIELNSFTINATNAAANIESLKMLVNGDEYEAKKNGNAFTFDKISIDEDSTIEFTVDVDDNATKNTTVSFNNSFDRTTLAGWTAKLGRYDDARSDITATDWAGSISLSNVRIQAAKGSLSASSTKDVEILEKQTSRKTIYEGSYTATKQDVYLNGFAVKADKALPANGSEITYYLSIDGKEVGSFDYTFVAWNPTDEQFIAWDATVPFASNEQGFSDVLVKNGEKVSIKLEANVYGVQQTAWTTDTYAPTIIIRGTDKDGNPAGLASDSTSKIKVVSAGSVTISESAVTPKESVEIADNNITIARFTVKSSKNTEGMTLKTFTLTPAAASTQLTTANTRVRVAWTEVDSADITITAGTLVVNNLSEDIPSAGVDVEVMVKKATEGESYKYSLTDVNGSNPGTKFAKKILASVASIKSQENRGDSTTKFTFAVDKGDGDKAVKYLILFGNDGKALNEPLSSVEEGTTLELTNGSTVNFISAVAFTTSWTLAEPAVTVGTTTSTAIAAITGFDVITKTEFRDFFKVGDAEAQVFRTK